MEGVRGYWKRRGYLRLKASREPHRVTTTRLGRRRPRLSWPRLNLLKISRSISPRKWLARVRDAYVDMMLRWSSSGAFTTGTIADAGMNAFGKASLKEYDEKVIVELHRLIILARLQDKAAETPVIRNPSCVSKEIEGNQIAQ